MKSNFFNTVALGFKRRNEQQDKKATAPEKIANEGQAQAGKQNAKRYYMHPLQVWASPNFFFHAKPFNVEEA